MPLLFDLYHYTLKWNKYKSYFLRSLECNRTTPSPLGMASDDIPDASITASSYAHGGSWDREPKYARLGKNERYWACNSNDPRAWIQVHLGRTRVVTGLQTEGNYLNQVQQFWVEQIKVQVGSIEQDLMFIEDGKYQPKVQLCCYIFPGIFLQSRHCRLFNNK